MKTPSKSSLITFLAKSLALSLALAVTGLPHQTARADTGWTGNAADSNWANTSNWDNGGPNGTNAYISNLNNYPIITANNTGAVPNDFKVGATTGANGRVDIRAGTFSTAYWTFIGDYNGTGTLNIADTSTSGGTYTGFGLGSGSYDNRTLNDNGNFMIGLYQSTGVVNMNTTGSLNVSQLRISPNGQGGDGTLNLDNGTVNVHYDMEVGSDFWGAGSDNAYVNMSGGTVNVSGALWLGRRSIGTGGNSNMVITGGTTNVEYDTTVGFAGSLSGVQSTLDINGGTFNEATTAERWMVIGKYDLTNATVKVRNGGTLNLNAGADIQFATGNNSGTRLLDVDGGTINGTASGGSYINMNQSSTAGTSTINIKNGGVVRVDAIVGAASSTLNFDNGTLKATANDAYYIGDVFTTNIKGGGAILDSNGHNPTVRGNLLAGDGLGGGVTKTGLGTLTMLGVNTYTGATTVNAGTLILGSAASIANSSGVVINGSGAKFVQTNTVTTTPAITLTQGTLDGTGTVGAVTVGAGTGGIVANGNGTTSQLTIGSLTFSGAGAMNLNIAGGSSPATPALVVSNGLTTSGVASSVTVNVNPTTVLATGTTYNLLSYGTTFSGSLGDFVYSGNTARVTGSFGNASNFITLTLNGDAPKWTGLDNGQWTTGSTGASKNWKLISATTATDYLQGDLVLFNDTATGTTNVDVSAANVSPTFTTFDNSTKNYTLGSSGTFGIAGSGALAKSGTGSLVITNANTYTGATTINAGTLQLGDGTSGHDGAIANTSGVTNNATLIYNRFGSSTAGYIISGTGSVVKNGAGTQILGGANTYSGGTTINSGTLQITTTAGSANSGTFTLNGGSFQINTSASNYNYAPTINVTSDSTTFSNVGSGAINYTGALTGSNNVLTVNSGATRIYINGTVSGITQFNVTSGAMGFDINNGNNRGTAAVNVANGAAFWYAGNNTNPVTNDLTFNGGNGMGGGGLYYEGGVPVPAALTGNITLASGTTGIGSQYADTITLNGMVSGAGALTQLNGTVILAGSNSYSGATTINAGTLQLGNGGASGSLLGSTAITNNGTLAFNRSDTITQGTGFGTITGTGGVTVQGGTVVFNAANTYTGTTLVRNGTLQVSNSINTPASQVQVGYGNTGSAVLDLQSGATVSASSVEVAHGDSNTGTQTGTVNIASGATLNSEGDFQMGYAGSAAAKATLNINGGTLNVATTATRWMIIGRYDTVNSEVNVNSGNLNLNANTDLRFSVGTGGTGSGGNGNVGTNVINLNGGAITSYSDNATTANGAGVLDLNRFGGATANNTFNLNGGTLAISQVKTDSNDGTVAFNFNGGTLKATGDTANFVDLGGASQTANVQAGGAIINSNGFNVTIPQALLSGTAGDGGLTKTGSGTLTLSASNSYTGATNVNNGTLQFAVSETLSALNIATSGTAVLSAHTGGAANVKAIDTSALTLNGSGVLDLNNNAMVVRNGDLAAVTAAIVSGANGGVWNGPGLVSSTAGADANHITTLGVSTAAAQGLTGSSFAGVAGLSGSDVLVKYTYYGDANFSGSVTGADYGAIDTGFGAHLTGWENGDFNLDGVVTGADYGAIDTAFGLQGGVVLAQGGGASSQAAAVPEPGTVSLMLLGTSGLLWRFRRSRKLR